jgi:secreted Zn-dependent insulinase-like peptidase
MHKSRDEKLKMLKLITFKQVINVPYIILNETKTNVKTVVLGNVTLDGAIMLSNNFIIFVSEHMQPKNPKLLKINSEETFKTISEAYNSKETNSAVFCGYKICEITYNIDELQIKKDNWLYYICVINILDSLISNIYFDQLRTTEQLGYITKAFPKICGHNTRPVMSYGFLVQSSHTKSEQLFNRIDAFLKGEDDKNKGCLNILNDVTDEEYNNSVESLRAPLSKDHESFLDEEIYYMTIICKEHDIFDLRERENDMYGTLTKQDIINFYQKYFCDKPIIWSVGINGN